MTPSSCPDGAGASPEANPEASPEARLPRPARPRLQARANLEAKLAEAAAVWPRPVRPKMPERPVSKPTPRSMTSVVWERARARLEPRPRLQAKGRDPAR